MAVRKYTYVDFTDAMVPAAYVATTSAAATASDNQVDSMLLANGAYFEYTQTGVNSDIVFTKSAGAGWIIPNDNTDNDGIEITQGNTTAGVPMSFTIGTDGPFKIALRMKVPDVSDYDVCAVGFRKQAAQADVLSHAALGTAYSDVAFLNMNAGDIYTITRDDTGTAVLTDTTNDWADNETHTFTVAISAAGVVTFQIDGAAPTVNTNTMTWDNGDLVIPCIIFTKNAGAASDTPPILVTYECGLV
jgi:hypothetical protein